MDPNELLFGFSSDLLREGQRVDEQDNTNYLEKNAAARDWEEDLSGSEMASEEEVEAAPNAAVESAGGLVEADFSKWGRIAAVVRGKSVQSILFFLMILNFVVQGKCEERRRGATEMRW
jgi:hypothetical protein